jgi:predicted DNA-binding WGR domain protein
VGSGYEYYSFPVSGGSYFIQWGNVGHTAEMNSNYFQGVSAYWKNTNSMTELSTSYFADQQNGLANPRRVDAPDSGYIIIRAYRQNVASSSIYNYDIRFYRE